jgi:4-diphosphocytidyl-2-C-methyl-D-erythritol kinase
MVSFPNCKINLGLKILRRREDGFHDLETVFYPLPVRDVLEIVRADELSFSLSGRPIPGDPGGNLCITAFHLLKRNFPDLPFVHIYLHKHIPIGGGLGGGSSDGALMLQLLDRQFQLGLTPARLSDYAAQLGSDCPFFLLNQPCLGKGRGEQLEPLTLDLSPYSFLIVNPGIHISTAQAFSWCTPDESGTSLKDLISRPVSSWRAELKNDFEDPVFREYPSLRSIKEQLYKQGALYASLTGSGSGLFGIFEKGKVDSDSWKVAWGKSWGNVWGPDCEFIAVP